MEFDCLELAVFLFSLQLCSPVFGGVWRGQDSRRPLVLWDVLHGGVEGEEGSMGL